MTLWKWSQTAATNSNVDSTINYAEGQAPSSVNDSARALMAAVAKKRDDDSGNLLTTGTSTAYAVSSNQVLTALTDGFSITVRIHVASGLDPTLNVDTLGAKQIRTVLGTNLPTAAFSLGGIHTFTYDSTDDAWIVHGRFGDSLNATSAPDLVAIEALSGTGILRRTGSNTWDVDASVADLADTTANRLFGTNGSGVSGVITVAAPLTLAAGALSVDAASDTVAGKIELAVQSEMETATDVERAVTPGRQHFHPGHPKFWAKVSNPAGTPSLVVSYNVTSITDVGVGEVTVTIATDFSGANYCVVSTCEDNGTGSFDGSNIGTMAAGSVLVRTLNTGASANASVQDRSFMCAGFGDQA